MLNLDNEHTWEVRANPFPIKVISLVLNNPVVTIDVGSLIAYALNTFLGGLGSETREICREMAMKDGQRIAGFRVFVEAGWQEYMCAEEHVPAPEIT